MKMNLRRERQGFRGFWENRHPYILLFLLAMIFAVSAPCQVMAEGEKAVSTLAKENNLYIFVRGVSEIQAGSSVQIGNTVCTEESISTAKMADLEPPMRTVMLIDNSQSISSAYHEPIQEILTGLIDGALEKEEFKIATISDTVQYLSEYSSDKEALKQIVGDMEYQNQNTYLSDVLYEVISELNQENAGVFTRIIVFADGADDKTIGYTNEEVSRLIEKSPYPVYAVGTQEKNNDAQLETLFSFSRAGNAEYYLLNKDADAASIVAGLSEDRNNICIRVVPDASLLDGSNKNILLKLNTADGVVELTTAADMPFGDGNVQEAEEAAEERQEIAEEETEEPEETQTEEKSLPVMSATEPKLEEEEKSFPIGIVIAIVVGCVLLASILAVVLLLAKKKKGGNGEKTETSISGDANPSSGGKEDITQFDAGDDRTEMMYAGQEDDAVKLWKKKYLSMKCMEKPAETYKVPIQDVVSIGRPDKDINLNGDKKVSHQHCEIILRGNLLYIKDTDSTNGTFLSKQEGGGYRDTKIYEETALISGSVIKIGNSHYKVELIEE